MAAVVALLGQAPDPGAAVFAALPAPIDHDCVAAVGLSLGGLTSTLIAFHPTLRDPRVGVAVSIAGRGSGAQRRS